MIYIHYIKNSEYRPQYVTSAHKRLISTFVVRFYDEALI